MSGSPSRSLQVADREVASQIVAALMASSGELTRMSDEVRDRLDPATFRQLALSVGYIMGGDTHDLLINMLTQHRDLDTHGILGPNGESEGPSAA